MSIPHEEINGVIVLHLHDKLMGGFECTEVKEAAQRFIDDGKKYFVIDFEKLQWSNSNGIGAIVSCYKRIREKGGRIVFARPTPKVKFYLHISKLETIFDIYDTVPEAVDSIAR